MTEATKTAVKQKYSKVQISLAKSLGCYVSKDDAELDRRSFLEFVRDRIDQDLATGEY
jgi:hypothetical protein